MNGIISSISYSNGAQSKPSEEVVYHTGGYLYTGIWVARVLLLVFFLTTDPMKKGVKLSKAAIGGIVGGLLFFIFTVLMSVCGVKVFSRNQGKRESVIKYGKFFSRMANPHSAW